MRGPSLLCVLGNSTLHCHEYAAPPRGSLRRKLLKKGYPSRVADNVSETRCEKHGADAPPVNERDVLTINDQAIELVKEEAPPPGTSSVFGTTCRIVTF